MTDSPALNPPARPVKVKRDNTGASFLVRIVSSWDGALGLSILLALVFTATFAPLLAPFGPQEGDLLMAKRPPAWVEGGTWETPLGTDQIGQDMLSRIIYGARISLTVSFFGVLLAMTLGITLGMLAGFLGGWVDNVISGGVNLLLSIPYLVLVIVIATVFGRSLLNVILIFGITDAPIFVRLARGEVLRLKREDYIEAAASLGARPGRIITRHLFPNLIGPLITLATFEMSAMIFYESGLGFLGLSVPPEVPSWGNMLALGRRFLAIYPWIAVYPGLAIAITALGINLLGDRLRDVLDPRLRQ